MNITLLDFDDSFTFNIASELHLMGLECQVLHWSKYQSVFSQLKKSKMPQVLILGPGPGHPDEYQELLQPLVDLRLCPHLFILGICLGHQLIARMLNVPVVRSALPVHGQSIECLIPEWLNSQMAGTKVLVQRYNSLTFFSRDLPLEWERVESETGEVMIMKHQRTLSYQFHPESIGTSYREIFFRPVLESLV